MESAPPGAIPPSVTVRAEVSDDLPGGNRGIRLVVAVDQEIPGMGAIVDGDVDAGALADSLRFKFACSLTPADIVSGDEGVL